MIELRVSLDLKELDKSIKDGWSALEISRAQAYAANKAMRAGEKAAVMVIANRFGVTQGKVRAMVYYRQRSHPRRLDSRMAFSPTRRIALRHFKPRQTSIGVVARIGGKKVTFRRAFIYNNAVFRRKRIGGRKLAPRTPIERVRGVRVHWLPKDDRQIFQTLETTYYKTLKERLTR